MSSKQNTGNIGLFYACYRLSLYLPDWNVLPTIRNARGADIILVKDSKKLGIQVKALSKKNDIHLSYDSYNDSSVDFWIVLMNVRCDKPKAFIIPQKDITDGMKVCKQGKNSSENLVYHDKNVGKNGKINYWLNIKFVLKSAKYETGEGSWKSKIEENQEDEHGR